MRHTWRLTYTTTGLGAAAGAGVVIHSLLNSRTTEAVAGLALLFISAITLRTIWEVRYLRRKSQALEAQRVALAAERGQLQCDTDRLRAELREREQELVQMRKQDIAEVDLHLQNEREELEVACANKKGEWERAAYRAAWDLFTNGTSDDAQQPAEILYLPLQSERSASMGAGNLN